MNPLTINNPHQAISLTQWCTDNLNNDDWDVHLLNISPVCYRFNFNDSNTHLLMALKYGK